MAEGAQEKRSDSLEFKSSEVRRIFNGIFHEHTADSKTALEESEPAADHKSVKEFFEKVENGDLDAVKTRLAEDSAEEGKDDSKHRKTISLRDDFGYSALHRACLSGNIEMAKLLLEEGADVNDQGNQDDASPLHLACLSGNSDLVELLLTTFNADPQAGGGILQPSAQYRPLRMLTTPLHLAAGENHNEVAKVLLQGKCDVEALDAAKETPLFKGCALGQYDAVKVLLENGDANPNAARQDNGNTCLQMTVSRNHPKLTELLVTHTKRKVDVNRPDHKGDTALWKAAERGHVECVKALLLDKELDINYSPAHNSITALHGAASRNHPEVVRLLLENGAEVDKHERQGCTALLMASLYGASECVKILLEHNADVNAKAANGGTALQAAAFKNHPEIVRILLEHNANVNDFDFQGDTALLKAAGTGATECIKLLLDHGANVDAARPYNPNKGATALHCASGLSAMLHRDKKVYSDIIYLLLKHGANADLKCEINGQLFTALDLANIARENDPSIQTDSKFYKLLRERTHSAKHCPCTIL